MKAPLNNALVIEIEWERIVLEIESALTGSDERIWGKSFWSSHLKMDLARIGGKRGQRHICDTRESRHGPKGKK